jgi:hypothetical protein
MPVQEGMMTGRKERSCQIRMSSSLWNLVGEIAQELGLKDARGGHSEIIREMVAAAAAKWVHSPYICRSARHTVLVTREGNIFSRHVQVLRLNTSRRLLPCFIEMKPEKKEYYHQRCRDQSISDEYKWFLSQWLLNYFAVWSGKKDADDVESFNQAPLSEHVDSSGTTYKNADLAVDAVSGRFLTREMIVGLRDYVQWKQPLAELYDRIDIPIDIPTAFLEICVIVDQDLFADVESDEISKLSLEFRNRESARFEGKEVVTQPEITIEEQYGRSATDDGANEMLSRVRRLWQRVSAVVERRPDTELVDKPTISSSLRLPQRFLFYWLRWPSPHLGIEACVRWEKPRGGVS